MLSIGIILSGIVWWQTQSELGVSNLEFCLSSSCIELFSRTYSGAIKILAVTLSLLVSLATTGGILVALMSYQESVSANSLSNHVSHLSLFRSYIEREIEKGQKLRNSSVDIHAWYFLMFPRSRSGSTRLSDRYIGSISALALVIERSNGSAVSGTGGTFRFATHQEAIISVLKPVGINLTRHSRMDFYEIEGEVFGLVNAVNSAFAYSGDVSKLPERKYR